MNILMLNPFFYPYPGGTEKHVLEVGRRLARRHDVQVLTARLQDTRLQETIAGIRVRRIPSLVIHHAPAPLPPPVPLMLRLRAHIQEASRDADIVHLHNRFCYGPRHLEPAKKSGRKLLLTLHNARPQGIDWATDFLGGLYDDVVGRRIMDLCDGITAVSRATLEETVPPRYRGETMVTYNGIDPKVFRPVSRSRDWQDYFEKRGMKGPMVFTNTRLVPQKGVGDLVEAMRGVDAQLVVFGRGPLQRRWQMQARRRGVRTHFISERLSDTELAALYSAVDVFVLPSLYEPCSVALLEAMACGKPVIGTRIGGTPEVVEDGKTGLLVPARSPARLRRAIRQLLADRRKARQMGKSARRKVMENYTWDHVAARVEKFYKYF